MPRRYTSRLLDFSGGIVGGISDYGRNPRHLRDSRNLEPRPHRALVTRRGTQRMTSAGISAAPHSLLEWVSAAGVSNKYVGIGASPGVLARFAGTTTLTTQTTPYTLQAGHVRMTSDQLHGSLVCTEEAGANPPMFYRGESPANTAETWLSLALPAPGAAPTFNADSAGGGLTAGATYYYRVRDRYFHGSSAGSAVSAGRTPAGPNLTINLNIPVPGTPRTDYLGWTLERTKPGATAAGPFYFVADGTGGAYADGFADGDLGYRADPDIHEPPGHFNGLIAHRERLFGWSGATLSASQAIDDLEATGIANFNPLNAYDFGKDDGEAISTVVTQGDRLLVIKPSSVWALEGYSPEDFRVVRLYDGAGASGLRAAASMGSTAWFYGAFGLHRIRGNTIEPFGWVEVGHILDTFSTAKLSDVVLKNHLGQRLLLAFSVGGAYNDSLLVYDQRFGSWGRWDNMRATDILVQKIPNYGDIQAFLFPDPLDRDSGAGTDFRCMIGNFGVLDERAADGTGGTAITFSLDTPTIDDGAPDVDKDYEAIELYLAGSGANVGVRFIVDPSGLSYPVSTEVRASDASWGAYNWGGFAWSSASSGEARIGLPEECSGKRWRVSVSGTAPEGFQFNGVAVDVILRPERRFSR